MPDEPDLEIAPTGVPSVDALLGFAKPVAAGEPSGSLALDKLLSAQGLSELDPEKLGGYYENKKRLESAKKRAGDSPESTATVYRRKYMPFSDVVGTNWTGLGGRVVGPKEYADASARFKEGKASDDDVEAIATHEAAKDTDLRAAKDVTLLGSHYAGKLALELGNLGKIGGEMAAGGAALGRAGAGLKALRSGGRPLAAAAGTAPAVPVAASLGSRAVGSLPGLAAKTAVAPSMYVPMMQEANLRNGRDPNDLRGLPTAFGYGMANMAVLGRLQKGLDGSKMIGAFQKGVLGMAELQGVDLAAGTLDQFLPKAYRISPDDSRWGTLGSWLRPYAKGDKEGAEDALEHASVQALSFAAFARLHGAEAKGPEDLLKTYTNTVADLRKTGLSRDEAGKKVADLHEKLEEALSAEPYMTRERAAERLAEKLPPELKSYAEKLAETFEPVAREVKEVRPPEPVVKPDPVTPERVTKGETPAPSPVTATGLRAPASSEALARAAKEAGVEVRPPVPEKFAPFRYMIDELVRTDGVTTREAMARVAESFPGAFPEGGDPYRAGVPPVAAAATSEPRSGPREKVDRLDAEYRELDRAAEDLAKRALAAKLNANTGGSLADMRRAKNEYNRANDAREKKRDELDKARDELMRQPTETAATVSKAPQTSPEAPVSGPSPTPPAPPIEPPANAGRLRGFKNEGDLGQVTAWPLDVSSEGKPQTGTGALREGKSQAGAGSLRDVGKFGSKPAAAAIPELPKTSGKPPHDYAVVNVARRSLESATHLSPEQRQEYGKSFESLVDSMPEACRARLSETVRDVKFYKTPHEAAAGNVREMLADASLTELQRREYTESLRGLESLERYAVGAYNHRTGTLHIDGQGRGSRGGRYPLDSPGSVLTREQIYAHEFGHGLDGPKFEHSGTTAWRLIWMKEFSEKARVGGEPALTAYAENKLSGRIESFAEFARILWSGDAPTSQIARDFPEASKYFQSLGFWPSERGPATPPPEPVRPVEVFTDRIGPPDGTHVDVATPPVPKPARGPSPQSRPVSEHRPAPRLRAGDRVKPALSAVPPKKPAAEPTIKPSVEPEYRNRIDPIDVIADRSDTDVAGLPEAAKKDPTKVGARIAAQWERSSPEDRVRLEELMSRIVPGARSVGTVGESVPFDPTIHKASVGVSTGSPVRVKRTGWVIEDNGRVVLADIVVEPESKSAPVAAAATGSPPVPSTGATGPTKTRTGDRTKRTPEEENAFFREQWQSMDAADRDLARKDPATRAMYESAGVDTSQRIAKSTGPREREAAGLEDLVDEVRSADHLSVFERQALGGVLTGKTLRQLSELTGKTPEGVRKAANRALQKMKTTSAGWEEFETAEEVITRGAAEAADRLVLENEQDILRRKESLAERGEVTFGKEGVMELTAEGKPVPLSWFGRLFGSAGDSASHLGARIRRFVFGDLPSSVRAAKEQEIDHRIASHAFDVAGADKDFRSALKTSGVTYESLDKNQLRILDDLLRVPPERTLAAAATAGIAEPVARVIRDMRAQVDRLSYDLVSVGAIDGDLVAAVGKNVGTYLTRQYEVFRNPNWFKEVDPAIVNRFKSWLYSELRAKYGDAADSIDVDAEVKSLLVDGTAAENPIHFLSKSRLGSKDLSILKARQDVPPELRALWGEYRDPLVNYTNSVGKMANLLTNHNFLRRVAREGLGSLLFERPTGDAVVKIASEGADSMSPLNGYYVTPELKRAFDEVFKRPELPAYLQTYMRALAAAKFSKVILSHTGQLRNFFSNVGLAVRNGYFGGSLVSSFRDIATDTPETRAKWKKLIELGVVGEELNYRDFADTVSDALGGRSAGVGASVTTRLLSGAKGFAEKWYRYGDSFWKVYAFDAERERYRRAYPDLPEAELERRVAEIVRDTMPTYSKVPEGVKSLRRLPFVAPFVSFQAEVVRTTKNNLLLALRELGDPATRSIGAQRLAGSLAAAAVPLAVAAWLRSLQGIDDDEERAVRRFLPDHERESLLYFVGRDDKGRPKYIDASRTDPHAYLMDAIGAAVRAKSASEAAANVTSELAKPFVSEELLLRPALDIARNRKEPGGEVYNPSDANPEKAAAIARRAADPFVPGGYGPARRLFMGLTGRSEQKTGVAYDTEDAVKENVTGQRWEVVRVEEQLKGKARGFVKAKDDAARLTGELIRAKGTVGPEELAAAAARTDAGRARAFEEFAKDVDAAEKLGLSRPQIVKLLKESELSQEDLVGILRGSVQPYRPPLAGTIQERQRAADLRRR